MTCPHFTRLFFLLAIPFVVVTGSQPRAERVTDIRVGRHEGFSRCVVEFDGAPLRSTFENRVSDLHVLYVDLWNAPYHSARTYSVSGDPNVRSIQTLYFSSERRLRIAISVGASATAKVMTLQNPGRVVIDFYWRSSGAPALSKSVSSSSAVSGYGSRILPTTPDSVTKPISASPSAAEPAVASPGGGGATATRPRIDESPTRSSKPIIVIDPGHGGWHKGGIGKVNGRTIYEKEITLAIANKTKAKLEARGNCIVKLTRTRDEYISPAERTTIAERFDGDLLISIHCNSVDGNAAKTARGLELWVWNRNGSDSAADKYLEQLENEEDSHPGVQDVRPSTKRLLSSMMVDQLEASAVQSRSLCETLSRSFLKANYYKEHYRGIKSARFKVLETYQMPSILIETGFLSHSYEARKLASSEFQNTIAQCLADGIESLLPKLHE